MVSLCLTKPRIDGRVTSDSASYVESEKRQRRYRSRDKKQLLKEKHPNVVTSRSRRKKSEIATEFEGLGTATGQTPFTESSTRTSSQQEATLYRSGTDTVALKSLKELEKLLAFTEDKKAGKEKSIESHREKMLSTLRAMGGEQRKTSSRRQRRHARNYTQRMPDATADEYRVHKWRLKSGRNTGSEKFSERTLVQTQQRIMATKEFRNSHSNRPAPKDSRFRNVEPRYLSDRVPKISMLRDKEQLFGLEDYREAEMKADKRNRSNLLPRLRDQLFFRESLPLVWENPDDETIENQSELYQSESRSTQLSPDFHLNGIKQNENSKKKFESRRASESLVPRHRILPPIPQVRRRQSLPMRRSFPSQNLNSDQNLRKRKASKILSSDPMVIPENEILRSPAIQMFRQNSINAAHASSPVHKKSNSSMTMHSIGSLRSSSKDGKEGDTPESEGSSGGAKYRVSRKNKGSRILTKMDTRNSPQAFRYSRPSRTNALMREWYICARLAIWLSRLYKSHKITVDDSYNIHHGSSETDEADVGSDVKKEVLFDVTDYKMKNQLRLSDTTRKVLSTPSENRTDKDVNLVQTALRNIKAVSDYSNSVQQQIGKLGYFVGFEGKRIVIKENKKPLNYYLLLAGSAVVIKSDDSGNTNPVLFMKRGDIFGEKEILDDTRWQWSVATSGYCEFLLLDHEDYKKIFITGGGGGLLSDPDRGGFMKSIKLLQRWPITTLGENPNRCLFRYFKRGSVLVKNSNSSEWIYVIKSGSCSALKELEAEPLSESRILYRVKQEQKFRSQFSADPRLVEKTDQIDKEDHFNLLREKEEKEKNKEISVYQQLEMSSILKELNPDVIGTTTSPRAEAGFEDRRSEFPLSSYNAEARHEKKASKENNNDPEENEFRLSRHSDRQPHRTPSPTKAAYLRTGISTRSAKRREGAEKQEAAKYDRPPAIIVTDHQEEESPHKSLVSPQKQVHINEYLFGSDSPDQALEEEETKVVSVPVYINVRRLTKHDVFGIEPHLYSNQPSLALVSNGAECLMLNKKFYLENADEDCMKFLREEGFPYPSDVELEEEHWRLMTWKAYQARVLREALDQRV